MKSFSNPCPSFHELKTFNVTVDGKIDIKGWKKKSSRKTHIITASLRRTKRHRNNAAESLIK